jgi:NADH-quinone oxidoreductase subunit E
MKFEPSAVSRIIKHYHCDKSNLLAILTDVQAEYNWLPPQALKLVATELCIPLIDVYSVASFYHAFSLAPRGKHIITVCQGTACHVRGAPFILNRLQEKLNIEPGCTSDDKLFTLETVNCLGACALAPVMVIDGNYHGQTTVKKADTILNEYLRKASDGEKTRAHKGTKKEMNGAKSRTEVSGKKARPKQKSKRKQP